MTLYEYLKNPLDDKETVDKIVTAYTDHSSLYSGLTRANSKNKVKGKYNVEDSNRFYMRLFADWKNALKTLLAQNRVNKEYYNQLVAVVRYIEPLHPKTRQEVYNILNYEQIKTEPLRSGIDTFRFDKIGEYSGWEHIHSNYVNFGLSLYQNEKHRIYINCDSTVTHRIMLRFIEKCNERKWAYYFKFDDVGGRDDNIVFYGDAKHIRQYITVLREVIKEEKLQNQVYKPPVCTSPIDGWMGYGAEPKYDKNNRMSFNEKREKHIMKCINDESSEWMARNLNTSFHLNGKPITYKEYLIRSMIRETKEYLLQNTRDTEYYVKYIGYTKKDLERTNIESLLRPHIEKNFNLLFSFYRGNDQKVKIDIPFKNGTITIGKSILEQVRRKQVRFMYDHSTRFQTDLVNRIKRTSSEVRIDPDNYACDLYCVNELGKTPKKVVKNIQVEPTVKHTPYKPTTRRTRSGMIYKPMTEEEIKESRKKLGF